MPLRNFTLRRRLFAGLLALFALSAISVAVALAATRSADAEVGRVEQLAEESRRLVRAGALFREYYMHQAHLALGMDETEHLAMTRRARVDLGVALDLLSHLRDPIVADKVTPNLRARLAELDALLDGEFLPALRAGRREHAAHVHHRAAGTVQTLTMQLSVDEEQLGSAIAGARSRASEAATNATLVSTMALGGAALLSLLVGLGMLRGIVEPVARLRLAAKALPQAPPGTRVPEDGPAELAELGRTLNAALTELDQQRQARAEAETLAALGRIAAGVAHEVNNPLGVILGHARLIERAGGEEAAGARAIATEAHRCQHIMRELLDYARPSLSRREPVDLRDLCRAEAERCGAAVSIPADSLASALVVDADERRLRTALRNLLSNALAFGEEVELTLRPSSAGAVIEVRDDGPGVPLAVTESIFEPFYTTRSDGTGLGLAIARAVATAHGGTLRAHPGPGGRFELTLPFQSVVLDPAPGTRS